MAKITMKDIARETGFSLATISKYVNGGNVKEEYATAIRACIDKFDYKPNIVARGLRSRKSFTIGIIVPSIENYFTINIVTHIEMQLQKLGYSVIVCDSFNDVERENKRLKFLMEMGVDGIIIVPCSLSGKHIIEAVGEIPVVQLDRICSDIETDYVIINNREISEEATTHLLKRAKHVAILSSKGIYTAEERTKGYLDAHKKQGIPVDENLIKYVDNTVNDGYKMTKELLSQQDKPDGIFCTNYEMTIGMIMAINELNYTIPEDLYVVGFDNIDLARVIKAPLPIVTQPMSDLGRCSAKMIVERIKYKSKPFVKQVYNAKIDTNIPMEK